MFDKIQDIADDASQDYRLVAKGNESGWEFDPDCVQRAKLQIDARKWTLAKLFPKKYGDSIRQEHSGPDGSPVHLELVIFDPQSARSAAASDET